VGRAHLCSFMVEGRSKTRVSICGGGGGVDVVWVEGEAGGGRLRLSSKGGTQKGSYIGESVQ